MRSPSSTPSRRSCISTRSTWTSLVPVALRQGRARRHRRRLHQLPARPRPVRAFIDALLAAEKTEFKEWEGTPYFDGCLPIEVMAERGRETLRWGPMKPVGLTNKHNPTVKAYAVVQLRQDNALGTLYNMTGFQTKLKYGEQAAIFRMIPGLQNAEFARLGGLHRNTY
jgi:tRNA:m(5)U-54 methyltransferase